MDINEMLREKTRIVAAMRQLLDKASAEKRELTAEEDANYTRMNDDLDALDKKVEREKRLQLAEGEARTADTQTAHEGDQVTQRNVAQSAAFRKLLLDGPARLSDTERRALQVDNAAQAGFWTTPQQFSTDLIQAVDDLVYMRQISSKETVTSAVSLGVPTIETDLADATWTSEIATGDEDSSLAAGKRELFPHPLAKRIKVSNKLLRMSTQPVDAIVRERLAYKVGYVEENGFLNGSGAMQPLGVFTASSSGISTSRDVSTGNSTTAVTADGLLEAKYSLKAQYLSSQNLRWLFHRTGIKNIRKLKDGNGQYIWAPGLSGTPDRILDIPFFMSELVPNTWTTGLYVGIIGDFRFYKIVDALTTTIQVLSELYAETNQAGYIIRAEVDGMPTLQEAFARVKLA